MYYINTGISKNMSATVEQPEIDGKFYLTINVIRIEYEVTQWNKQIFIARIKNIYLHISKNMGATVEQDEISDMIYLII